MEQWRITPSVRVLLLVLLLLLSLRLLPVGGLFYGVQGPLGDGLVASNVLFHRGLGPFSLAAVSTRIAENIVECNEILQKINYKQFKFVFVILSDHDS